MKKLAVIIFLFLGLVSVRADDTFGNKLLSPAKVNIINNLSQDTPGAAELPYIYVLGVGETKYIWERIERNGKINLISTHSKIICMNDNLLFVYDLEAGNDYIIMVEKTGDDFITNMVNTTVRRIYVARNEILVRYFYFPDYIYYTLSYYRYPYYIPPIIIGYGHGHSHGHGHGHSHDHGRPPPSNPPSNPGRGGNERPANPPSNPGRSREERPATPPSDQERVGRGGNERPANPPSDSSRGRNERPANPPSDNNERVESERPATPPSNPPSRGSRENPSNPSDNQGRGGIGGGERPSNPSGDQGRGGRGGNERPANPPSNPGRGGGGGGNRGGSGR